MAYVDQLWRLVSLQAKNHSNFSGCQQHSKHCYSYQATLFPFATGLVFVCCSEHSQASTRGSKQKVVACIT